eukprot:gnl/Trimastix_PCT/1458.p1 GENE.gnl/Trimastix_PCT/1458~~gnl/Trimastix_PCT/1458.p1  ORF type:complete len:1226 (+),score=374.41 gnl/Trimastix_PCT/1458:396-3680(+)
MACGGGAQNCVTFWNWEKQRAYLGMILDQRPILECGFHPDGSPMSLLTQGALSFLEYTNQELRRRSTVNDIPDATCHAWYGPNRLVVGCESGRIVLVEGRSVIRTLDSLEHPILQILSCPNGVVCIDSELNLLMCPMDHTHMALQVGHTVHIPDVVPAPAVSPQSTNALTAFQSLGLAAKQAGGAGSASGVQTVTTTTMSSGRSSGSGGTGQRGYGMTGGSVSISVSPNGDWVAVAYEHGRIVRFRWNSTEQLPEELVKPFHYAPLTASALCVRKAICATASEDCSIRVINFHDRVLELSQPFTEQVHSISLHPSGLHVVAGFHDKLRLMNILMDEIRPTREFKIKECRVCSFSHGGHYFAAVNNRMVLLFNTYTGESVGKLSGHSGPVTALCWSPDDHRIISASSDGAVYEWPLGRLSLSGVVTRSHEVMTKTCHYHACALNDDGSSAFAVGSDAVIREVQQSEITNDLRVDLRITCLVCSKSFLFAGSMEGVLRAYRLPLDGTFSDIVCHSAPIRSLSMSRADSILVSTGADGVLIFYDVADPALTHTAAAAPRSYSEEILATKQDLEEKAQRMRSLHSQVTDINTKTQIHLQMEELENNERIKEVKERFNQEIRGTEESIARLRVEISEMNSQYDRDMNGLNGLHLKEKADMRETFRAELASEYDRFTQLTKQKNDESKDWKKRFTQLLLTQRAEIQGCTQKNEDQRQQSLSALQAEQHRLEEENEDFDEMRRQILEDTETELRGLREIKERELDLKHQESLSKRDEITENKNKYAQMEKQLEDLQHEFKRKEEEIARQIQFRMQLEREIKQRQDELRRKDQDIKFKETLGYELKKKNQDLEKHKFVKDFEIKELKHLIGPREHMIKENKSKIAQLSQDLEQANKRNQQLRSTKRELSGLIEQMKQRIRDQTTSAIQMEARSQNLEVGLSNALPHVQDPVNLHHAMAVLYQNFIQSSTHTPAIEVDVAQEYDRQHQFLEDTRDALRTQLLAETKQHKADKMRIMLENMKLIREINDLHHEIKCMKHAQKAREMPGGRIAKRSAPPPGVPPEVARLMNRQREEIGLLRQRAAQLNGAISRETLPTMEGFHRT